MSEVPRNERKATSACATVPPPSTTSWYDRAADSSHVHSAYLDERQFEEAGIQLEWMEYDYPEYPQLHPPFDPHVTILDLLFMTGDRAGNYIWP